MSSVVGAIFGRGAADQAAPAAPTTTQEGRTFTTTVRADVSSALAGRSLRLVVENGDGKVAFHTRGKTETSDHLQLVSPGTTTRVSKATIRAMGSETFEHKGKNTTRTAVDAPASTVRLFDVGANKELAALEGFRPVTDNGHPRGEDRPLTLRVKVRELVVDGEPTLKGEISADVDTTCLDATGDCLAGTAATARFLGSSVLYGASSVASGVYTTFRHPLATGAAVAHSLRAGVAWAVGATLNEAAAAPKPHED